jgi:predicted dehydrogenase
MELKPIRFGLIGVGGFARAHLEAMLALEKRGLTRLEAVADPNEPLVRSTLTSLGRDVPPAYTDYRAMLAQQDVEAVAIATPLHLHCEMAVAALRRGCHVFLEKPPVVSLAQWNEVMTALRDNGKRCAIDFQWMSSDALRDLKRWIVEGRLGELQTVVGYSHQKRYDGYYARAAWAGRIHLGDRLVRDGSVNNPMAHQLNNALYLASERPCEWAQPVAVRAELYRAHPIETEDTSCTEIVTQHGPRVYFYTTLCSKHHFNHSGWIVTGTKASAVLDGTGLALRRGDAVVETISYKAGQGGSVTAMMENLVLLLQGSVDQLLCPFEKTRPFVASVEGMFLSSGGVTAVPPQFVRRFAFEDDIATEIADIDEQLAEAAKRRLLLSDLKIPWATATNPVSLPPG